jgi:hypothetical protein
MDTTWSRGRTGRSRAAHGRTEPPAERWHGRPARACERGRVCAAFYGNSALRLTVAPSYAKHERTAGDSSTSRWQCARNLSPLRCASLFTGIHDRGIIREWGNGSDIPSTLGAGTNPFRWKRASQLNGWNGADCRALLSRIGSAADRERMSRPRSRFKRQPTLGFMAHDEKAPVLQSDDRCGPEFLGRLAARRRELRVRVRKDKCRESPVAFPSRAA